MHLQAIYSRKAKALALAMAASKREKREEESFVLRKTEAWDKNAKEE